MTGGCWIYQKLNVFFKYKKVPFKNLQLQAPQEASLAVKLKPWSGEEAAASARPLVLISERGGKIVTASAAVCFL